MCHPKRPFRDTLSARPVRISPPRSSWHSRSLTLREPLGRLAGGAGKLVCRRRPNYEAARVFPPARGSVRHSIHVTKKRWVVGELGPRTRAPTPDGPKGEMLWPFLLLLDSGVDVVVHGRPPHVFRVCPPGLSARCVFWHNRPRPFNPDLGLIKGGGY